MWWEEACADLALDDLLGEDLCAAVVFEADAFAAVVLLVVDFDPAFEALDSCAMVVPLERLWLAAHTSAQLSPSADIATALDPRILIQFLIPIGTKQRPNEIAGAAIIACLDYVDL